MKPGFGVADSFTVVPDAAVKALLELVNVTGASLPTVTVTVHQDSVFFTVRLGDTEVRSACDCIVMSAGGLEVVLPQPANEIIANRQSERMRQGNTKPDRVAP